ncbi:hypothetical protein GQ54DRAFT_68463 [Martensiomyces pterosporus]|nr:hypothetical protein GQ54DRAFT_68463 [Martensiomyces pterosporus]
MLPAKQQKVDLSKLSEEEKAQFRKYGRLPANKNERKYFDSGDYALSKAGKTEETVGEKHPSPESIPHHPTMMAPPPLASSPSSTVNVVPIATGINSNTMLNPSGLSPPSEHQLHPALGHLHGGHLPNPSAASAAGGPIKPPFERRVSQPSGLQYRTKE